VDFWSVLGGAVRRIQTGSLNWNNIGIVIGIGIVLAWLLWGVV